MFAHVPFGSGGGEGGKYKNYNVNTSFSEHGKVRTPPPETGESQMYKYESSKVHLSKTDWMEKKKQQHKHPI